MLISAADATPNRSRRHQGVAFFARSVEVLQLMDDDAIQARIEALEHEEQQLRKDEESGDEEALPRDRQRLAEIKVELDQLWDLLRQRRALREAGRNPDDAQMRDPGTVERYLG
jgi:hypothetical protein